MNCEIVRIMKLVRACRTLIACGRSVPKAISDVAHGFSLTRSEIIQLRKLI
jgi:hypothetical protein